MHNDSGFGRVALIAGTSMEGTEAAGESFLDPGFASSLTKLFGVDEVKHMPDFEVVLQTEARRRRWIRCPYPGYSLCS